MTEVIEVLLHQSVCKLECVMNFLEAMEVGISHKDGDRIDKSFNVIVPFANDLFVLRHGAVEECFDVCQVLAGIGEGANDLERSKEYQARARLPNLTDAEMVRCKQTYDERISLSHFFCLASSSSLTTNYTKVWTRRRGHSGRWCGITEVRYFRWRFLSGEMKIYGLVQAVTK